MKHKKKKQLSERDKERIACRALADLFKRDVAEIVTDPRYMRPEQGPIQIVGELRDVIDELQSQ